jgi:hypothetical protein
VGAGTRPGVGAGAGAGVGAGTRPGVGAGVALPGAGARAGTRPGVEAGGGRPGMLANMVSDCYINALVQALACEPHFLQCLRDAHLQCRACTSAQHDRDGCVVQLTALAMAQCLGPPPDGGAAAASPCVLKTVRPPPAPPPPPDGAADPADADVSSVRWDVLAGTAAQQDVFEALAVLQLALSSAVCIRSHRTDLVAALLAFGTVELEGEVGGVCPSPPGAAAEPWQCVGASEPVRVLLKPQVMAPGGGSVAVTVPASDRLADYLQELSKPRAHSDMQWVCERPGCATRIVAGGDTTHRWQRQVVCEAPSAVFIQTRAPQPQNGACLWRERGCCDYRCAELGPPLCGHCLLAALLRNAVIMAGAVLCCAVLCCAVLCCAVLCCAVLCCAVLCCAVLCCAVLCCAGGLEAAMPLQPTSASPQLRLADRDYVLRAAVLHQSNNGTLRGGHYSTVAKRGARWWVCNDTTVSELAAEPQETKLVTDSCYGVRLSF